MRFARWVYAIAGIYGILILVPGFFLISQVAPPSINHPEFYYGFYGTALAWQIGFLLIARREVPLLIHLLVLLFESGLATRQALSSIVREGEGVLPELGREFDLVVRQVEAGADLGDTLRNLCDVLPVDDLVTVLGILRQVERYGGELREPLLETLKAIEEQRGYELRERVNLMSGRMTLVMVLFFFPALMIFVAGPAFLAIIIALDKL